jgi:hypothetical protein
MIYFILGVCVGSVLIYVLMFNMHTPISKVKNTNRHPAADEEYYQIGNAPALFTKEALAYGISTFSKNQEDIK